MKDIGRTWKLVSGFKTHKLGLYSAYYDGRNIQKPIIRVIGVTRVKKTEEVICRLYYDVKQVQEREDEPMDNNLLTSKQLKTDMFHDVPGIINVFKEHANYYYHACYIICPLNGHIANSEKTFPIPTHVSIVSSMSSGLNYTDRLPIVNSNKRNLTGIRSASENEILICVKPIHSLYNNWLELVTFLELNKILGVSKFVVYNESMSENVSCVLKYYKESENSVSVMPWNLLRNLEIITHQDVSNPKSTNPESIVKNRGALAALNDCVYQNMYEYQYLISTDLDEFIIPHIHDTIPEMLEYIRHKNNEHVDIHGTLKKGLINIPKRSNPNLPASYIFQNAMFYLQYGTSFKSLTIISMIIGYKMLSYNIYDNEL